MKKCFLFFTVALILLLGLNGASADEAIAYQLGDKIDDLTVIACGGQAISLYEMLETKEMVLIHLFSPSGGHEFPIMEKAYRDYQDQVGIIALSADASHTPEAPAEYAENMDLGFLPAQDAADLHSRFDHCPIPASIVIDRFGAICYIGGAIADADAFTRLFDAFTGDDYADSLLLNDIPPAVSLLAPDLSLTPAAISEEAEYTVFCVDQNGDPVANVMVQICDDATCMVVPTNADGKHTFASAPNHWDAHVLIAPEGYSADGEVISLPETGGEAVLFLRKN